MTEVPKSGAARRLRDRLLLAAGFGIGGGLMTFVIVGGEEQSEFRSWAVGAGLAAGLFPGLLFFARARRWLDDRLLGRFGNWLVFAFIAGVIFLFVFDAQCNVMMDGPSPEAAPWLGRALAAGIVGLWTAVFLAPAAEKPPKP